jgi:hypothetical protein
LSTITDEQQRLPPRTSIEQRCIKSGFHGPEVIRTYVNELVIATSELEARGSLIYTLALLRCSEQEGLVPVEMFSQIFMTRCLGVARGPEADARFRPSEICQRYLVDALQHVPPMLDYDFTHFGQLYNQLGRRMHTMIMTSLSRHMNSRRSRTIRTSIVTAFPNLSKSVVSFVTKHTDPLDTISCVGTRRSAIQRPVHTNGSVERVDSHKE